MSISFNLHPYWMLNLAIAASYLIAVLIFKQAGFNNKVSQKQQLKSMRKTFIMTLFLFLFSPLVIAKLSLHQTNVFQFQPFLQQAPISFLKKQAAFTQKVTALPTSSSLLKINILFYLTIFIIFFILLMKYTKNILDLKKITHAAYCQRKIKNIHILFSETTTIPFCWSSITNHYIIIPSTFLEKTADLKFAIRHELQHIRQGDTYWLHLIAIMSLACFWNPLIKSWGRWFSELQEFACDEALVLNKKMSRFNYAQCLIDTASTILSEPALPRGTLGIIGLSQNHHSLLNRRITMLFNYKKIKNKKMPLICAYTACFLTAGSFAYALDNNKTNQPITIGETKALVNQSHLHLTVTPEIISEINHIRGSEEARLWMTSSLERMKQYKPYIETQLAKNAMPNELLALPLVESGYNVATKSPVYATGIWQFIPSTAKHFDLSVDDEHDERLDTQLSTQAAIRYLKVLYAQFQDWQLAVIAYEIGERNTSQLINTTQSHDAWTLARAPSAPKDLKKFLAMYEASVIIMNNPELVASKG